MLDLVKGQHPILRSSSHSRPGVGSGRAIAVEHAPQLLEVPPQLLVAILQLAMGNFETVQLLAHVLDVLARTRITNLPTMQEEFQHVDNLWITLWISWGSYPSSPPLQTTPPLLPGLWPNVLQFFGPVDIFDRRA